MIDYGRFPAIPTTYRGIRMRSRLEARWAAFFDRLGWEWEYEPDHPKHKCAQSIYMWLGGWLADFHIVDPDIYIDIKPLGRHYRPRQLEDTPGAPHLAGSCLPTEADKEFTDTVAKVEGALDMAWEYDVSCGEGGGRYDNVFVFGDIRDNTLPRKDMRLGWGLIDRQWEVAALCRNRDGEWHLSCESAGVLI